MKIGHITLIGSNTPTAAQTQLSKEVETTISSFFIEPSEFVPVFIPNEREPLRAALVRLCDDEKCPLVFTLGHTGPAARDFAPDITLEIVDRKLPGFGEIMRYYSYERFKVSVLSRAEAGVRGKSLIINLPGKPKPVKFCLKLLREGIAEALDQISGTKPGLKEDQINLPLDKYLPFLKKIRPKPNPDEPEQMRFG
jgi:molybdopterin adenylyltransferase